MRAILTFGGGRHSGGPTVARWGFATTALAVVLLAACTGSAGGSVQRASSSVARGAAAASAPASPVPSVNSPYSKVLVVAEENETYEQVLGRGQAPYLSGLATAFGSATNMFAGDPVSCPSLPSYLLMTSGDRYGICDDNDPAAHPIAAANIFQQV